MKSKVIENVVGINESYSENISFHIIRGIYEYTKYAFKKSMRMKRYYMSDEEKNKFVKQSLNSVHKAFTTISDEELEKLIRRAMEDSIDATEG